LRTSRIVNPTRGVRAGATVVEVDGVEVIDVDRVNDEKVRHGHSYYASSLEVLADIAGLLNDRTASKTPSERLGRDVEQRQTASGFTYWAL